MAFNINTFRSTTDWGGGILRTNKFRMRFQLPVGLFDEVPQDSQRGARSNITVRYMEYFAESAVMPGLNILTHEARKYTFGPAQKRPFVTGFNDLVVTFYDESHARNWQFLLDWMHLINNSVLSRDDSAVSDTQIIASAAPSSPYEINYRDYYVTDCDLHIFTDTGRIAKGFRFRELYPIAMADTPLNWSDLNSLLRLTVNFHFLEWYEIPKNLLDVQYTQ